MNSPESQILALSAPRVPSTEANGGLNWRDLYDDPEARIPVQVVLPAGNEIGLNDRIDLKWESELLQSAVVDQTALQTRVVTFLVRALDLTRFSARIQVVNYLVTAAIGGSQTLSPNREVVVKTLIPGGPDPEPATPYINENLALLSGIPEVIEDDTQSLTVTACAYENMDSDDAASLEWGGQRLTPSIAPVVGNPVTFTVTRAVLEASVGKVIVRYQIRDLVNNWSKWSRQTDTDVEVGAGFLQAPRAAGTGVVNGEVDLVLLGDSDLLVQIPVYTVTSGSAEYVIVGTQVDGPQPFMEAGDRVQLIWSGRTADGTVLPDVLVNYEVTAGDVGWPIALRVPNAQVKLIASGYATMRYSVTSTAGLTRYSRRVNVPVIGNVQLLPAPAALEATGSILDPDTLPSTGATIHIPASELIAAGDFLQVTWSGTAADGSALVHTIDVVITGSMAGRPIERFVDKSFIVPLINGKVDISYVLNKGDGPVLQSPITTLQIRTSAAQLPAPAVDHAEGDQLDPDKVPANGTVIRVDYTPVSTGELVSVHWAGATSFTDTFTVPPNWNGKVIPFDLAKTYVDANRGNTVQVYYTVALNGITRTSASKELSIQAAGPREDIDDFSEHDANLIVAGGSVKTKYTTIRLITGTGSIGFDPTYILPPTADTQLFANPVLQVSYRNIGQQTVEIEFDTPRTAVSFNVHGVAPNGTQVRYLDTNKTELYAQTLAEMSNQTVAYASTGGLVRYLEITSRSDWTLWDNFVLTV